LWGLILTIIALVLAVYSEANEGIPFLKQIPVLAFVDSGMPLIGHSEINFFKIIKDDFDFELISILFIIGGFLLGFSRQKIEDEYINQIRLQSLLIATYVHFAIVIFLMLSFYGLDYLYVIMINMFTILWIFNLVFYYKLFRLKKQMTS
jgi:hypothetical protein